MDWKTARFVVNFLRVPGNEGEEDAANKAHKSDEKSVSISHAAGEIRERMKSMGLVREGASPFFSTSIPSESELDWCVPSIDMEAKVEDGWLSAGVFAPADMLDEGAVDRMIKEIKEELESVDGAE